MKAYLILTGFLASALLLQGQDSVDFSNYKPGRGIDAAVLDSDGTSKLGIGFMGQLYAGANANALAPIGAPVPFRNLPGTTRGSGYIVAGKVNVTGASFVSNNVPYVYLRMCAWEANAGATYEAATGVPGARTGKSTVLLVQLASEYGSRLPEIPSPLIGLQGFSLVAPNQPPFSTGFGATTPQNQALQIPVASLMAPVTDPEGSPVTWVSVNSSTNGALVVGNSTVVVYFPTTDFVGADWFSYVVSDALGATNLVWAQIAVLAPGVLVNNLQSPTIGAGTVALNFTGLPGRIYQVQRALSATGPWEIVGPMTIQPDGSGDFVDPSPLPASGFYRTQLVPSP